MNKIFVCILCLMFLSYLTPKTSLAKIGVGVGTGKIQVDEQLRPGVIYKLPSITVINTGDESSNYEATVAYHQEQKELRPDAKWFNFSPQNFKLDPGKTQIVEIKINLPVSAKPGNYFAYLEAHPAATVKQGNATIGVAAASKLYFTIVPANVFMGIYYKIASFWKVYAPWPQRVLAVIGGAVLVLLAKKFLHIEINLKKQDPKSSGTTSGKASVNPAKTEPKSITEDTDNEDE